MVDFSESGYHKDASASPRNAHERAARAYLQGSSGLVGEGLAHVVGHDDSLRELVGEERELFGVVEEYARLVRTVPRRVLPYIRVHQDGYGHIVIEAAASSPVERSAAVERATAPRHMQWGWT